MNKADSSDEEVQGRALLVEDDGDHDFDLDIPPTTGNEYLRRVRMEASGCPKVVVANINTEAFQQKQTVQVNQWSGSCHPAPKGFAPTLAWQQSQVADFAEVRQKLARHIALLKKNGALKKNSVKLPQAEDVQGWCTLCFGKLKPPAIRGTLKGNNSTVATQSDTTCEDTTPDTGTDREVLQPLISVLAAMDQATVVKVLEYHVNWFEATGFSPTQGSWFYSLLACVAKPLDPDVCSLLRSFTRSCACLRATLESPEDPRLVPLNLFICLISRYFEQTDLADPGS